MLLDTRELENRFEMLEKRLAELEAQAEQNRGSVNETEAAKFLQVSKNYLWKLRTRGLLPYAKVGERVVYLRSDLNRYLESRRRQRGLPLIGGNDMEPLELILWGVFLTLFVIAAMVVAVWLYESPEDRRR